MGISVLPSSEFSHDTSRLHATGKHMTMVSVGRYYAVRFDNIGLKPDHHSFLAYIEVAKTADQAHPIELSRTLLKAAYHEHVFIKLNKSVS